MAPSVLDLSVLETMFGDDQDLINDILAEFKLSAAPYAQELSSALSAKNIHGVRSLAHKLKSSSRAIGALELAALSESLEGKSVIAEDWLEVSQLAKTLEVLLQEVVETIDNRLLL